MISNTTWSVIILVVIFLIMVGYIIVIYELYKNQIGLFAPYVPPPGPPNSFYPLGSIKQLTPEQIVKKNQIIEASLGIGSLSESFAPQSPSIFRADHSNVLVES